MNIDFIFEMIFRKSFGDLFSIILCLTRSIHLPLFPICFQNFIVSSISRLLVVGRRGKLPSLRRLVVFIERIVVKFLECEDSFNLKIGILIFNKSID